MVLMQGGDGNNWQKNLRMVHNSPNLPIFPPPIFSHARYLVTDIGLANYLLINLQLVKFMQLKLTTWHLAIKHANGTTAY